ncbi:hypothetical protein [Streptomyces sp. NPDC060065]|uniref:hypothetical protein n=1 Tax=Streptomyces sp. NPDC060065 TaxID=3347050 RepID=UPI0036A0926C
MRALVRFAARLSTLVAAVALLVIGSPTSASAQCVAPTYNGGLPVRAGNCPEGVAGGASGLVWAVVVLAVGVWLVRALSRSRSAADAELGLIDEVFGQEERTEAGEGQ